MGMMILLTFFVLQLTALQGVLSRTYNSLITIQSLVIADFIVNISVGPIGPITFTALLRGSINIQIDKGPDLGLYQYFTIHRANWETACNIPIYATLTDCADKHAAQGRNHYRIGARYNEGSWIPDNYYADTLQQDRTFPFVSITRFHF